MHSFNPPCPECGHPMQARMIATQDGRKDTDWICTNNSCEYSVFRPWVLLKKEAVNMPQSKPVQPVDNPKNGC